MPFLFILLCALAGREAWEQGAAGLAAACLLVGATVAVVWAVSAIAAELHRRRCLRAAAAHKAACDRFYTTFYEEL